MVDVFREHFEFGLDARFPQTQTFPSRRDEMFLDETLALWIQTVQIENENLKQNWIDRGEKVEIKNQNWSDRREKMEI